MFSNQILDIISGLVILFPAFLIVFTVRGFFKTLVAKLMGDSTAYDNGFLSLNPLAHIDFIKLAFVLFSIFVVGILFSGYIPRYFFFVLIILLGVGWTTPPPINENNFKNHILGVMLITFAGPLGCFLLALLFFYISFYFPVFYFPCYFYESFLEIFRAIIEFSVFFGVLDLIPLPPFDASRLLGVILPLKFHFIIEWLEKYHLFIFFALFFLPGISNVFFGFIYFISFVIKKFLVSLVF